ncbi:dihydroorotate dehydrogenase [Clostridium niameyense]|uniref:Dihydroorotate dehydrogenase n=1 Tax=Clostridium niameyense TaxID=1622073 RepID=A0A6M0RDC6_9CLOT|nr:dihydroorotate dehydrogenase [Clostridium niameyense]NEZ47549.1 dihydroorotate dehydrogenase [Clostridium niameyense]
MLSVNLCGLDLKNPIIAASGTFGFGQEYNEFYDISELGAICTKGLTLNSKEGNDGIRIHETSSGIMNSVGLQNPGVDKFIKEELPNMEKMDTTIIANVGGSSIDEYIKAINKLNNTNVDMIELNISCPNVKEGGMAFGIKSDVAYEVVKRAKEVCDKPLIVKLSPNAENIIDMAYKCEMAGADAISLVNTFKAMAIDIKTQKSVFKNITAGLSGPCIKPIALRMVYEVCKNVKVPVIGIGGITSYKDVLEFIMVGATAVQIGTGNFIMPTIGIEVINDLKNYMYKENIKDLNEIRGIVK